MNQHPFHVTCLELEHTCGLQCPQIVADDTQVQNTNTWNKPLGNIFSTAKPVAKAYTELFLGVENHIHILSCVGTESRNGLLTALAQNVLFPIKELYTHMKNA